MNGGGRAAWRGTDIFLKKPETQFTESDLLAADGYCVDGTRKDGKLLSTFYAEPVWLSVAGTKSVWHIGVREEFLILADDGKLTLWGSEETPLDAGVTSPQPYTVDEWQGDELAAYLVGTDGAVRITADSVGEITPVALKSYGGLLKNGRIFAADSLDNYRIFWTGEKGISDIIANENLGWVRLTGTQGKIQKLMNMESDILVVRERGFAVMTAYGNPENFKVTSYRMQCPQVNADSVAVIGGKVYFFSDGKIYCFDKSTVKPLDCPSAADMSGVTGAAEFEGAYYIAGRSARLGKKTVLRYDPSDGSVDYIDCEADKLCVNGGVYCFGGRFAYAPIKGGSYRYYVGETDLGKIGTKCITRIETRCANPVRVTVETECGTKSYTSFGAVYPALSGKKFKFTLTAVGEVTRFAAFTEVIK